MKQFWDKPAQRFDALQPRERMMIFLAGAAIIAGLAFVMSIDGGIARQKALGAAAEKNRADLAQLQRQNADLSRLLSEDPDVTARARIQELQHQLAGYDNELRGVQQGLVPPKQMVKVLEDMLNRDGHVRLVKLRTLPVTALVEPADAASGATPAVKLPKQAKNLVYKHGLEMTVEGAYLDLLGYQARLEKLPWRMFFARTKVDSSAYPKVLMTVTLYTLSLEETWLVV